MMRGSLLAAALFAVLPLSAAHAQQAASSTTTATVVPLGDVDALETRAMTIILSGEGGIGTRILGQSPMMAGRTSELALLDGQIAASLPIYGRALRWERIGDRRIGTYLVHRRYIVQHQNMLTDQIA